MTKVLWCHLVGPKTLKYLNARAKKVKLLEKADVKEKLTMTKFGGATLGYPKNFEILNLLS